ncbi:FecR family protein [Flavobacterium sp. CS20]|uniref:FecR family protein n=1 Tax=Flavobacterium sp. CS20 TaxID=2775246 RepID=UPI001B3A5D56|nr:FecR family protein [Flavobacterium sp. CS20]QTY27928.1 FecR family protein [Flavobacterium sp. CS20]
MEQQDFWELIIKHLLKETSAEEDERVKRWLQENPEDLKLYIEIKSNWNFDESEYPQFNLDNAKKLVRNKIFFRKENAIGNTKKSKPAFSFRKIATIIFLLIGLSGAVAFWFSNMKLADDVLVENNSGKIKNINLPDGSKIWLTTTSKIRYPRKFEENYREIYLEGEAFFEVQHNAKRPFSIYTQDLKTTVLGTSFNISAYPDSENISVTVATGKVSVSRGNERLSLLTKDEKLTYSHRTNKIHTTQISNPNWNEWKNGQLIFKESNFGEVATILEKRYQVTITFKNESAKNCPITASFNADKSINEILDMLCRLNPTSYKLLTHDQILITGKGCLKKDKNMQ